ncbi:glycerol-3-phosphate dehydrogenase/oxidase [Microbacterium hydrocarbonoxydans]|uniref:glycerol-3-phosphate dehydrogenase/oxidase n=1 Tax=Microbacterium hydrocarbonoxydans TaxID=273678 RepID=UPI00203C4695|nr:glycerol-3-phosphate dehydrogenase/oxidase [Microbacterium hydrocarbonoxydans]MCM3780438.1 glycerol-3-phosphate dehydrogenase/oxidase [Microbacterium hydrocarbonoxydans]
MSTDSADLNAARRAAELDRSTSEIADVLVVGGGITGVGAALDAALRGLSVTLIEAHDLAYGTSRFSSKLVHGGLRYLATGDVATARESAVERHLLMTTIAPHLIRPLGQLLPFVPEVSLRQRTTGAIGMALGDVLRMRAGTSRRTLPAPRPATAANSRRLAPGLVTRGLRGGMLSFDGQLVDDARLVATVARTAAAYGARILTRVRASSLRTDGAAAEDALTGTRFDLRARSVINATGAWAGTLDDGITIRPSRGTHIVLDAADVGHPSVALTIPHEGSISRFVFALPQLDGRVIVGLTDEDAPGPVPDVAAPTETEIGFLLENLNRVLEHPLTRDHVRGAFAGLRPLVDTGAASTADISRRHLVTASEGGFIDVLGGKLTTYRRMAEDAVDLAVSMRRLEAGPSRTVGLRLVDRRVPAASAPLVEGIPLGREEVVFAVRSEGALTASDVLDRRTRVGLVDADRARCESTVEAVVAETLAELV